MFLSYQRVDATATVKTAADLTIPAKATHVELQADGGDVLYTMDDTTSPSTAAPAGMRLQNGLRPETFLIEDLKRIKFVGEAATGSALSLHYFAGRDI